jgi:hypothetical protein
VAKNCVCQEISSKSNRRRRFYTTKHVNFFGLSVKFVLRISCYHLTSFSSFYLCLSISVSAYFLVSYLVELKYFERKLTRKTKGRFFTKVKTSEHVYQNEFWVCFLPFCSAIFKKNVLLRIMIL